MADRQIRSECEGCGRRLAEKRRARGARFCSDTCRKTQAEKTWRAAHPDARVRCLICAKPFTFERIRKGAKFCTTTCSRVHHQERYRAAHPPTVELSPATVATYAETIAIACFLRDGFEVFRAVAPASCHLIIERGDQRYRVQVRTVNRRGDGSLASTITKPRADLLCIVARDDFSIVFLPEITAAAGRPSQTRRATASPPSADPPPPRSPDGAAEPRS